MHYYENSPVEKLQSRARTVVRQAVALNAITKEIQEGEQESSLMENFDKLPLPKLLKDYCKYDPYNSIVLTSEWRQKMEEAVFPELDNARRLLSIFCSTGFDTYTMATNISELNKLMKDLNVNIDTHHLYGIRRNFSYFLRKFKLGLTLSMEGILHRLGLDGVVSAICLTRVQRHRPDLYPIGEEGFNYITHCLIKVLDGIAMSSIYTLEHQNLMEVVRSVLRNRPQLGTQRLINRVVGVFQKNRNETLRKDCIPIIKNFLSSPDISIDYEVRSQINEILSHQQQSHVGTEVRRRSNRTQRCNIL